MNWIKENFAPVPNKPKGWVTINDIVSQTGNSKSTVKERISKMVNSGHLEVMDCRENGKIAKCYRQKK